MHENQKPQRSCGFTRRFSSTTCLVSGETAKAHLKQMKSLKMGGAPELLTRLKVSPPLMTLSLVNLGGSLWWSIFQCWWTHWWLRQRGCKITARIRTFSFLLLLLFLSRYLSCTCAACRTRFPVKFLRDSQKNSSMELPVEQDQTTTRTRQRPHYLVVVWS